MFTRKPAATILTVVFASIAFGSSIFGQSSIDGFDPFAPSFSGDVNAVALLGNGQMYVGGTYTIIGGLSRSGIALLNHDGTGNTLFNATGVKKLIGGSLQMGTVNAIVVQADGKIIVGGDFTEVNGVARANLARLDQFGNLDTGFIADTSGPVFTLVLPYGNDVIAGGAFTSVNGSAHYLLARINQFGVVDNTTNFDCQGTVIYDLKRDDKGRILIAGAFGTIGSTPQGNLARLSLDGKTVDTTFRPDTGLSGSSIGIQADKKIVFGYAYGVRRFYPDGTTDPALNIATTSWVEETVIQPDGKILIGGFFNFLNAVPRNYIARINLDGSPDYSFDALLNGPANSVKLSSITVQRDGNILIGGRFETLGSVSRRGFGRVFPNGPVDATTNLTVATGIPLTIVPQADGKTLIGGNFTSIGGVAQSKVSRLTASGTVEATFPNLAIDSEVDSIAVQADGKILIAGGFTTVGGSGRTRLARLHSNGTLDTSFAPTINNQLFAVAIQTDGKILIGGTFTSVNGTLINGLARLNPNGTLDAAFNPNVNTGVMKIRIQPDGKILIGGYFSSVNGITRVALARLTTTGLLDLSVNVPFTGIVQELSDIALQLDGKILIAGSFAGITGTSNAWIARLLPSGAVDTTFTGAADGPVNAIAVQADGRIIVAGRFTALNSTSRQYMGRFNSNGTTDTSFIMNADDIIASMALQRDGKIVVGGQFANIGGQSRVKIARIANTYGAVETMWNASPRFLEWSNGQSAPQVERVTFERSTDGVAFTFLGNGTVGTLTTNWSLTGAGFGAGYIRIRGYYPDASNATSSVESVVYVPLKNTPFDFDGDGKTDASVYRPSTGAWYLLNTTTGFAAYQFGAPSDILTPADYTGDGKTDVAVFRPSTGTWFVLRSEDNTFYNAGFGTNGDIPAPGDYDGDGRADLVVYRPGAQGYWYLQQTTAGFSAVPFGIAEDKPAIGDYDGDGKLDISVYRPSLGNWYRFNSSNGSFYGVHFGAVGDMIVPGDYTGDGKTDNAIFRPSESTWYILRSETPTFYSAGFGAAGDTPTPGDYDGDGRADLAVWRPGAQGTFFIQQSTAGFTAIPWGLNGDRPTANAYVY
jgi:uncharacterized delta-60 repeat protein